MKKNKIITVAITICLSIMVYFALQMFDPFHSLPVVELKDNLTATQNEKVIDISYIEDVRYGKIVSKEKKIDTKTIGKKKVVIEIENNYGKQREYIFYVEVIK